MKKLITTQRTRSFGRVEHLLGLSAEFQARVKVSKQFSCDLVAGERPSLLDRFGGEIEH